MLKTIHRAKIVCVIIALLMLNISVFPQDLFGLPIKSKEVASQTRLEDTQKILDAFKQNVAKSRLLNLRIKENDLKARLDKLSDAQIHRLAQKVEFMSVGSGATGIALAVAIVALIIITVLYITDYSVKIEPKHKS